MGQHNSRDFSSWFLSCLSPSRFHIFADLKCFLKCLWSENYFYIFVKYNAWNTRLQNFRCLGLKLTILQALKVVPFCTSKMVFELSGHNTTWQEPPTSFGCHKVNSVWRKVRQARDKHRHDFKDARSEYTLLCSAHFEKSCYETNLAVLSSMEAQGVKMNWCLKNDTVPTRDTIVPPAEGSSW